MPDRLFRFARTQLRGVDVAKFETVPLTELKTHLPAQLMPLVENYKVKLGKLDTNQGGKLVLEKGTTRRTSGRF